MILQEEGLTSESYFRVKLEEREFWNFENLKWELENSFCIVHELKESENHPSTSFKKLWVALWVP